MSKELTIYKCVDCPYRRYNDGGGFCEPWHYCSHPLRANKVIDFYDMRSEGNHDVEYYDFPKWCPIPDTYFGIDEMSM